MKWRQSTRGEHQNTGYKRVKCKGKNRCLPIDFRYLQFSIMGMKTVPRLQLKHESET